ncbi:LysM peptidoglycan-binding domain-containing protein [Sporolactobacillus kofuensis]|uniref:LysM peptidoglycan-binding domain-containing protein n=1 Tax=Sporolactobacillus kofuensis TaxID=269672 RepID=A0ABW1WBE1_9BACL|nr:LysM peptidoglycan-binding domain-containing protein [Sporolactobacillus kofuensis]MCO7174853.1 LysM peptidoglycan-binding domain-containing protein [Sporolactobacillus kofuensis]
MQKAKFIVPALISSAVFSATAHQAYAATGKDLVSNSMKYLGIPYKYGAAAYSTQSFDCSSFTQYLFKKVYKMTLPRTSTLQSQKGLAVNKANLINGDLLFFDTSGDGSIDHVGIYIGNGKMISSETYVGVHITNVFRGGGSEHYWKPRFIKARRINPTPTVSELSYQPPTKSKSSTSKSTTKITYTVKRGDSLSKIANNYHTTITKLKSLNKLSSNMIRVGEKLTISSFSTSTPKKLSVKPVLKKSVSKTSTKHTVKSGESLWEIATLHGTSINKLMKKNNLSSTLIYPGQKIYI